jgi:N-methylhydantoinase B
MTVAPAREIDPFTVEIVKDSLVAIGDEMFVALQRTSKSTIIYEVLDFASGLTDARGRLITQGNGVTGFLSTLAHAVRHTLDKFGPEGLEPGDVVVTNDPYTGGGTHLSDVTLVVPVFYDDELVAFSASKAHWTEVGGKDPGSWTTDSTEVFQEGLQFPCVKLFGRGELARLVTGTGGGWGDPHERSVEEVVEDVRDGYVSSTRQRERTVSSSTRRPTRCRSCAR